MQQTNEDLALRCHDISLGLSNKEVAEFEIIPEIGLMVRLALHIRGLPRIDYEVLKLVSHHYLQISPLVLRTIVKDLAEVEFIRIMSEGNTIKYVLPTVPYYDDIYAKTGEFAKTKSLNEAEHLAITILNKLTASPILKNSLHQMGVDKKLLERSLQIGTEGNYLLTKKCRGKDILLSPVFFSENFDIYADMVAKSGAKSVQRILDLLKKCQGIPLAYIEAKKEIQGYKITDQELNLLKRLASDGAVKPPSIATAHAGTNYFMFTPKLGNVRLSPTKRELYERAMALVSAVRLGQYLPKEYAIRNPYLILKALKDRGYLRANTEAYEQYKQLTYLRVGKLQPTQSSGWYKYTLIDTPENKQSLDIAISLVDTGFAKGMEIDDDARIALGKDQTYIESIVSSNKLRERESVSLSEEHQEQIDMLFLGGL